MIGANLSQKLCPFWRYYGGKWRAAPRYPAPRFGTIIEPFAGAAGYSMRYPDQRVILIERYAVIAEMWRWLIAASPEEVRAIPCVENVAELPSWVPAGARSLVGFTMNDAVTQPRRTLSAGRKRMRDAGHCEGWCEARRELVASQVRAIKHWQIIEGEYTDAPDIDATWFVDPPYNNKAGRLYVHHDIDYQALGEWCRTRKGLVIACENEGATWLPFRHLMRQRNAMTGATSTEAIWTNDTPSAGEPPPCAAHAERRDAPMAAKTRVPARDEGTRMKFTLDVHVQSSTQPLSFRAAADELERSGDTDTFFSATSGVYTLRFELFYHSLGEAMLDAVGTAERAGLRVDAVVVVRA